jgi:hypothetical protein
MLFSIYYRLYRLLTSLMLFSTPEVATTPTILRMCNGWCLCLCMTFYVYGYCILRLVHVYGCVTSCECVYGWFLYAYGNETWLIVFVVDDVNPIIGKMCWLFECTIYVIFVYLKPKYNLEIKVFTKPEKSLFLAARKKATQMRSLLVSVAFLSTENKTM